MLKKKSTWQDTCKELVKAQEENSLSCRELSHIVGYSHGTISQCLTLGYALRVYPELEKIKHLTKALEFIKDKKFKRKIN